MTPVRAEDSKRSLFECLEPDSQGKNSEIKKGGGRGRGEKTTCTSVRLSRHLPTEWSTLTGPKKDRGGGRSGEMERLHSSVRSKVWGQGNGDKGGSVPRPVGAQGTRPISAHTGVRPGGQ